MVIVKVEVICIRKESVALGIVISYRKLKLYKIDIKDIKIDIKII